MKQIISVACVIGIALCVIADPWVKGDASCRPTLLKQFGDVLNTPDSLVLDAAGNLYLSAVNGVDGTYPGHIWRMDKATGKWSVFTVCKTNPKTHAAYPMGLAFDPEGNLYYADAQYFADPDYQSRILRVVIRDGEPQRIESVVEHIKLPNGLRWRDGALYFTESFFNVPGKFQSGVYRVPAADLKAEKPARLLDKNQAASDPYCVGIVETVVRDRGTANGKPEIKPTDPSLHIYTAGCDGMDYDAARNRILLTAAEQNGIYAWDIAQKKMSVVWANGDTDGADGLLDQPCEVLMLDANRALIVNIDAPSPFMVNKKTDAVHTLSVIQFKER